MNEDGRYFNSDAMTAIWLVTCVSEPSNWISITLYELVLFIGKYLNTNLWINLSLNGRKIWPKFREGGQQIFSLKVTKNYLSRGYWQKFGKKNVIKGVNLVKIGHFWWKWSKLGNFGGQNDVIGQNLVKVVNKFYL